MRLAPFALAVVSACLSAAANEPWWQRGADTWYYKDDWKGLAVSGGGRGGAARTIRLSDEPAGGWILVWGERGYEVFLGEKRVGASVDGCLIDDYDLTKHLPASKEVTVRVAGARVCAEGEIVDRSGKRYAFATGADWRVPGRPGAKLRTARVPAGPSHGAFHRAHNARLTTYNAEQRGKTAIARCLARLQRLREQGIFRMRRLRPAGEIVSFDPQSPWRRAERLLEPPCARAHRVIAFEAVAAQTAGNYAKALEAAQRAAALIAAAEAPVGAAAAIYRAEREITHGENLLAILGLAPARGAPAELRALAASARRDHARGDWAAAGLATGRIAERLAGLAMQIDTRARAAGRTLVGGVGELDEFPEDRFAWLNARRLMGNDPADWPFAVHPSSARYLDLAGRWDFRTDPDNVGEKRGWATGPGRQGWRKILAPLEWERQGVTADNRKAPGAPLGRGTTGRDKPYNGFAWYRTGVHVPASWRPAKLVLTFGHIATHFRVFLNGRAVGEMRPCPGGRRVLPPNRIEIPPERVAFGEVNTIAIQVYNHDNLGGIIAGPLALHAAGAAPETVETPGPLAIVRESTWTSPAGVTRQALLAGAMSPGVLVACDRPTLELWGWQVKGYGPPRRVRFGDGDGAGTVALDGPSDLPADVAAAEWLLLTGSRRAVVVVPGRKLASAAWRTNPQGRAGLRLRFAGGEALAGIVCLPPGAAADDDACRFWARAMQRYPVSVSECVTAVPADAAGRSQRCALRYNALVLPIARGRAVAAMAPVPMLASFARKHKHPHLAIGPVAATQYASAFAPWLVAEGTDTLTYTARGVDRTKVMKGVGELFARSDAARNVHGGLSEREMFRRMGEWGFDHCRYALAFGAKWDLPLVAYIGGPITDDQRLWKRLDELVKNCNDAGLQMMLCSFPEIESRKWLDNPKLQRNTFEFWRRIARRYAHLPKWAISYDPFNEPAYMNTDHWKAVMTELTRVIRSVDKTHTIVWESGDGWAQPQWSFWMEPVRDDNVLYSFHHYGKHWGYAYDEYYPGYQRTRERAQIDPWLEAILFGLKHDVAIHCGEFGLSMVQPAGAGEEWLDDYLAMFERFGIGWNWWNYAGDNIYRTGLAAGNRISPFVPILRKWMSRSGWGKARRAAR